MGDSAWQRQLQEIREQLERALSPELRERLAELQRALRDLDAEQAREALERLAEAQREMREALERSRELFRRDQGGLAALGEDPEREQVVGHLELKRIRDRLIPRAQRLQVGDPVAAVEDRKQKCEVRRIGGHRPLEEQNLCP